VTDERGSRLGSFLLGGIVGGLAGLAAGRMGTRRSPTRQPGPPGLAAFEQAPCYQELLEDEERRDSERRAS
jgi:hypothetical protein